MNKNKFIERIVPKFPSKYEMDEKKKKFTNIRTMHRLKEN